MKLKLSKSACEKEQLAVNLFLNISEEKWSSGGDGAGASGKHIFPAGWGKKRRRWSKWEGRWDVRFISLEQVLKNLGFWKTDEKFCRGCLALQGTKIGNKTKIRGKVIFQSWGNKPAYQKELCTKIEFLYLSLFFITIWKVGQLSGSSWKEKRERWAKTKFEMVTESWAKINHSWNLVPNASKTKLATKC